MNHNEMSALMDHPYYTSNYYLPDNRKWKPLGIGIKTGLSITDCTRDVLIKLGFCNELGMLEPLFFNKGLLLSFTYINVLSKDNISETRIEYLISPLGLYFLQEYILEKLSAESLSISTDFLNPNN